MGASMNMSAVAFDVAWSAAALGDLPTPLSVPAWGPTMAQRRQLEEQAWNELHRCGLAHGRELSQSTQQALRVLGDASVELYGYFGPEEQPPMSVMAAARGDVAVLACVHQNRYDITQIWPSALAESVAATLPMLGQGPGQALNASERAARGPTQDSGASCSRWARAARTRQRVNASAASCRNPASGSANSTAPAATATENAPGTR